MRRIAKAIYQTADEIEANIRRRESDALLIDPGSDAHRVVMKEIAQLRIYADAKRWISSPALKPVHSNADRNS